MALQKRGTMAAPIVVNPSQDFYGPDGSWSTFRVVVGTPKQSFDVVASTASSETLVVVPEGCTPSDIADCPQLRGGQTFNGNAATGFLTNQSSTWDLTGLYALQLEADLGYEANAQYGTDVVGVNGGNGSNTGGTSLRQQVVGGIAAKDYFLGVLGLGIQPTNFASGAPNHDSFLVSLKKENLIPSLSYGFTAGAAYRNKKVLADLILGGYDQSRFEPSGETFTFSSQDTEVLQVGVQSIVAANTLIGTTSFTSGGNAHLSVIDSTVPHIWLPRPVCDLMESALGLQYDSQSDLYLINDTMHDQLRQLNPTFTFAIGNNAFDNGNKTNIELPYAAFDLQIGWPVYSTNENYFPIRRAANDTQYTLGRAFLQEAYLVVDYERRNFTIGQAKFPDPLPARKIFTIQPKGAEESGGSGLGVGAIAGIAVGAAAIVIGAVLIFFLWWRRKKQKENQASELEAIEAKKRSDAMQDPKFDSLQGQGAGGATEMSADGEHRLSELPITASDRKTRPHSFAQELDSPRPVYEMAGDSPHEMEGSTPKSIVPPSPYGTYRSQVSPHLSQGPYRGSPQPSPQFPR